LNQCSQDVTMGDHAAVDLTIGSIPSDAVPSDIDTILTYQPLTESLELDSQTDFDADAESKSGQETAEGTVVVGLPPETVCELPVVDSNDILPGENARQTKSVDFLDDLEFTANVRRSVKFIKTVGDIRPGCMSQLIAKMIPANTTEVNVALIENISRAIMAATTLVLKNSMNNGHSTMENDAGQQMQGASTLINFAQGCFKNSRASQQPNAECRNDVSIVYD
jgi:hypothetical protein